MIRAGKFLVFEGPVCGKDKHDAPNIYRYFIAIRGFYCKHKPRSLFRKHHGKL